MSGPQRGRWLAVSAPLAAACGGGLGSRNAPDFYARLRKPSWAPPATVFGPVWSGLYAMIAVAGWRMSGRQTGRDVWALHGSQLALNAVWPWTFFNDGPKARSLAVNVALDTTLAAEVLLLARRDRGSAALLSPYLAWCLFATVLNAAVGRPDAGSEPDAG